MSTLLLFPSAADPANPPPGIASLAGYLGERGKRATIADLNVRAYNELLSAEYLAECAKRMEAWLANADSGQMLAPRDAAAYDAYAENVLSAGYLIEHIDGARAALRDHATYRTRQSYARMAEIVRRALQFVSAAHYPAQWSPGGFSMSHSCTSSAGVLAAIADRDQNLFLPFFERVMPDLLAPGPRIVGISLNYYGQMIPAMTLAAVVKRLLPSAFVVVGGGLVCFFEERWAVLGAFRHFVDGWIPFEGEKPLLGLVRAIESAGDIGDVDGLLRFGGAAPVYRPASSPIEAADFPVPDYHDVPLGEYLAPEPVLPMLTSRGCYWAQCAFCSHARLYRGTFRRLSPGQVATLAMRLSETYSVRCFYFVDEAVPPATAAGFAEAVRSRALPFLWFGETRLERWYTAERLRDLYGGGCRMLIFGLESAVPRLLGLMAKGIAPEPSSHILRACADAGIRTFVMFFTGFPTETRQEATRTVEFVEQHAACITHVATGRFILERQSPAFRRQDLFGLTDVERYDDGDLKTWYRFRAAEGQTAAEVSALVAEIEQRPGIRPAGSYLLSRSHLVFLPPGRPSGGETLPRAFPDFSFPERMVPSRTEGLLPRQFAFNLDGVRQAAASPSSTDPLPRNPTQYVFHEETERLIEVGPDGKALLSACDGQRTLAQILDAVGEGGRPATIAFFDEVTRRRFVDWKAPA
jgi:hypothetical protein